MKYLLSLIAMILGFVIGYYVAKRPTDERKLVLRQSSGVKSLFKDERMNKSDLLAIDVAEQYLTNYKNEYGNGSTISFSIDSLHAAALLKDPRCTGGLRAYFGLKDPSERDSITLMFMGIDDNRENIPISVLGRSYVIDYTNPCPKDCPPLRTDPTDHSRTTIKP